jgi:trehalose synthase-fused probable maltokinase
MSTSSSSEKSFLASLRNSLPPVLPQFLSQQRWFGGKARTIRSVEVSDIVPFCFDPLRSYFILVRVNYADGPTETYDIPLVHSSGEIGLSSLRIRPDDLSEVVLKDALTDEQFLTLLLDAIAKGISLTGARGEIRAVATRALPSIWQPLQGPLTPAAMNAEQSNSSVVFEKRLVLKIFRRVEVGLNPDLEIGSFLTGKAAFRNVPPLAGSLEYLTEEGTRTSLGMLQGYVANQGDAWQFTLHALAGYYDKALQIESLDAGEVPHLPLVNLCAQAIPELATQRIGSYLESATLLGRRTAELHLALASAQDDPDFAPQPFSQTDHQARVSSAVQLLTINFELLRRLKQGMPDHVGEEADKVLKREDVARRRFELSARQKWSAMVTRIHGDYHLGQVLFTGSDFVIIDFEGEPARPLEERRKKLSPLQDVAGMLRSFHYAAYAPLLQQATAERSPHDALQALGNWAQYWQKWVSAAFLKAYLEPSTNAVFIPKGREELGQLLDLFLLEKAVYELGYELNNRPSWVRIPLDGISQLLQASV